MINRRKSFSHFPLLFFCSVFLFDTNNAKACQKTQLYKRDRHSNIAIMSLMSYKNRKKAKERLMAYFFRIFFLCIQRSELCTEARCNLLYWVTLHAWQGSILPCFLLRLEMRKSPCILYFFFEKNMYSVWSVLLEVVEEFLSFFYKQKKE